MIADFFVQLGVETTHGTAATTFVSVPVEEWETELKGEPDFPEEARGTGEEAHVALRGLEVQESSIKGRIYHDTFEPILRAAFGVPTVVANADGTRTLTFVGKPDPQSLTARWFDKVQGRQSVFTVIDELSVEFGGEDKLAYALKMMGLTEADVTTPTPAFTAAIPFVHWQAAVTLGGAVTSELVSYKLQYNRNRKPFYTARGNAANPRAPLRFDEGKRGGSLECVLDFTSQAEYNQAKALAQRGIVVTFTDNDVTIGTGTRKPSIKFEVPRAVWSTKSIDVGGDSPLLKVKAEKLLAGAQGSVIVTLETV